MSATLDELDAWLSEPEAERLEFKEAKANFHFETLAKYCAALANEGGGKIIFGVTDRRPRRVVGSTAFAEPGRTVAGPISRLGLQITSEEILHANGRVLVFHVPPRPAGVPIQYDGVFWSRAGDELRPLSPDRLRRIFQESGPDFSAELHPDANLDDLDPALVDRFRQMWMRKSGNAAPAAITTRQLLEDAELMAGGKVTHAALVLLGTWSRGEVMNLLTDVVSKTGSFLAANIPCFQSVICTADCGQSQQSVQTGKAVGKRRHALWPIAGECTRKGEDGA